MPDQRHFTIMLVPHGSTEARTYRIPYVLLRRGLVLAAVVLLMGAGLVGSWWFMAARAHSTGQLRAEVAAARADREQVQSLAQSMLEVEAAYERLRALFGADAPPEARGVWLRPGVGTVDRRAAGAVDDARPTSWPLTERGFLTQPLVDEPESRAEHPGIDVAVPTGSYIRAAGPGLVVDAGEDPVYGMYLIIDHGDGFRSLYAHASAILVGGGERVRRHEVVALTGSTGRSTAPHLHFEILRDGEPVDPLTMLVRP